MDTLCMVNMAMAGREKKQWGIDGIQMEATAFVMNCLMVSSRAASWFSVHISLALCQHVRHLSKFSETKRHIKTIKNTLCFSFHHRQKHHGFFFSHRLMISRIYQGLLGRTHRPGRSAGIVPGFLSPFSQIQFLFWGSFRTLRFEKLQLKLVH